jgi:hypothetical protein
LEKALVQTWTLKLLDVGLVELSKGEYASTIVMPTKKDIVGNWTKQRMCGDYHPVNKKHMFRQICHALTRGDL